MIKSLNISDNKINKFSNVDYFDLLNSNLKRNQLIEICISLSREEGMFYQKQDFDRMNTNQLENFLRYGQLKSPVQIEDNLSIQDLYSDCFNGNTIHYESISSLDKYNSYFADSNVQILNKIKYENVREAKIQNYLSSVRLQLHFPEFYHQTTILKFLDKFEHIIDDGAILNIISDIFELELVNLTKLITDSRIIHLSEFDKFCVILHYVEFYFKIFTPYKFDHKKSLSDISKIYDIKIKNHRNPQKNVKIRSILKEYNLIINKRMQNTAKFKNLRIKYYLLYYSTHFLNLVEAFPNLLLPLNRLFQFNHFFVSIFDPSVNNDFSCLHSKFYSSKYQSSDAWINSLDVDFVLFSFISSQTTMSFKMFLHLRYPELSNYDRKKLYLKCKNLMKTYYRYKKNDFYLTQFFGLIKENNKYTTKNMINQIIFLASELNEHIELIELIANGIDQKHKFFNFNVMKLSILNDLMENKNEITQISNLEVIIVNSVTNYFTNLKFPSRCLEYFNLIFIEYLNVYLPLLKEYEIGKYQTDVLFSLFVSNDPRIFFMEVPI